MDIEGNHTTADVKLPPEEVSESLRAEMQEMVNHEAFRNPVKFMPDTHGGLGPQAIVGFSMPLGDRVVPNTVGGDIGCGMTAVELADIDLDEPNFSQLDDVIRTAVPMGFGEVHDTPKYEFEQCYPWEDANEKLRHLFEYLEISNREFDEETFDGAYFQQLCRRVGIDQGYAERSFGTLGSGNHFVEVAESERDGSTWIVVHSGSRNLGQKVAAYWQDRATEFRDGDVKWEEMTDEQTEHALPDGSPDWEKIRENYDGDDIRVLGESIKQFAPDTDRNKDLDYLDGEEMYGYLRDMIFAQEYAAANRYYMTRAVADCLDAVIREVINSPHNYVDFEDGVIRKGSTRALENETFVVPMNMKDGTLVCRGKGNPDWNRSAPHGAGRLGGRRWAKEQFDADSVHEELKDNGIYTTNVPGDEVPQAYKATDLIEQQIQPTAEIIDRLTPAMNFKA